MKKNLSKQVRRQRSEFEAYAKEWQEEARELYDFCSGEQWSQTDKAYMEERMRPMTTFNRMSPFIDAVVGLEIQNRQEVRFIPRTLEDTGINDLLTSAAMWVRDLCDADIEETDAFFDLVLTGMGWTNTRLDYDENDEGKIVIERIDPLHMEWDSHARKRNLADARWVKYNKRMSVDEIREKWPEAEFLALDEGSDAYQKDHDASSAWKYENDVANETGKRTYIVSEYQYFKPSNMYKIATPNGMKEMSADDWNKMQDHPMVQRMIAEGNIRGVKFQKRVYYRAFLADEKVLEHEKAPCQTGFTYRAITGKRDRNKNTWHGLGRALKDPQRWTNKFFSSILHQIATNGKGVMVEEDAIDNQQKFEDSYANPDEVKVMRPGAISQGKVMPVPQSPYPQGMDRLMQFSVQSFYDVSGINIEMMGQADRQQPGVVEMQRKQAGLVNLAWAFDALKRYRREQGRILCFFIKEFLSDGRIIRIVGKQGAQYIPLLKDYMTFEYDVIVDDAPTSPNMKERVAQVMMQFLPALMQFGIPVPPDVIDFLPLPEELRLAWKKHLEPKPEQQEMQQIAKQEKVTEIQKDQSVVELNRAKAENLRATGQKNVLTGQAQAAKSQSDAAVNQSKIRVNEAEIDKKNTEAAKNIADIVNPQRGKK